MTEKRVVDITGDEFTAVVEVWDESFRAQIDQAFVAGERELPVELVMVSGDSDNIVVLSAGQKVGLLSDEDVTCWATTFLYIERATCVGKLAKGDGDVCDLVLELREPTALWLELRGDGA